MGRPRRIDIEGGVHHVMNRGVDRQPIFFDDHDRIDFGRRLQHVHDEFGVETLAYCLMDNHYHLLLYAPGGGLPDAMHHIGSVHARHVNGRLGRDGPLFRGRFRSILVTTDAYLQCAARYIHRNPLDRSEITSIRAYRWSSYRSYLGVRPTPPFVSTSLVLGLHGDDPSALARFTEADELGIDLDAADLAQLIDAAIAQAGLADDLAEQARARRRRDIVSLLLAEAEGRYHRELSRLLGSPSDTARRMALSRARRRAADDPSIGRILDSILRDLGRPHRAA